MNALSLRVAAGHYGWLERRLFEVLGGWVRSVPDPEVKVLLRAQSHEHAWHARLWDELVAGGPGSGGPGPGPDGALAGVVDAVAGPSGTAERLAGMYRVLLPRLVDAYGALSDAAVPSSDGPLVRALSLMLADDVPAIEDAERLIGVVGGDQAAIAAIAGHQRRIDTLLSQVGGVGPPQTD